MDVLEKIKLELSYLLSNVEIELEETLGLLNAESEDFECVISPTTLEERYWIPWSEQIGASVSTNGHHVLLVVSHESTQDDFETSMTTGLASVIAGACLNLRDQVAIHANAVLINGYAVAFVGYSGVGKSTLSAYCASQGAGFITDDVLVVDDQHLVHIGNPRIKLYPQTGEELGLDTSEPSDYKIYYHPAHLGATLPQHPSPLGILYFPAESENGGIYTEPIAPSQAIFDLITHSYYANNLIPKNPPLLDAYIGLVAHASVRKLFYPRDFSVLPKVYDVVLGEIQELS